MGTRNHMDRLSQLRDHMLYSRESPWRVKYPKYTLKVDRNPIALRAAASDFERRMADDKVLGEYRCKMNHFMAHSNISKKQRHRHVNDLYDHFVHQINRSLINNNCIRRHRRRCSKQTDPFLDDDMQSILRRYELVLDEPDSESRTCRITELENEIKLRSEVIKLQKHQEFAARARQLKDHHMESALQQHLSDTMASGSVIEYDGKLLFDDADIVANAVSHFQSLIGHKPDLHGYPDIDRVVREILENSHDDDHGIQSRPFTMAELDEALRHFPVTKAQGIDTLSYYVLRELGTNQFFMETLLLIINTIYALSTYPDRLNVFKLLMLRKRAVVHKYGDFRGLTIMQNLKCIIHFMRYQRIKYLLEAAVHDNQAAYRRGHSPVLAVSAMCTAIKQVARRNGAVYGVATDFVKAFDKVHRGGLVMRLDGVGVCGRNIRLFQNDCVSSVAEVVYDGIHSQQFRTRNGNLQGGVESGDMYNVYMKPTLERCLFVKTLSYGINLSAFSFSDDGAKLAKSMDELQCSVDLEAAELKKWNLGVNGAKSFVFKYSRKKNSFSIFQNEADIEINGVEVEWTREMNIIKFLGVHLNFNNQDFMIYHVLHKVSMFSGFRSALYFRGMIGGNMSIDIQRDFYLQTVRTAFLYGMPIIPMRPTHYDQIDKVQRSYLRTISGCSMSTDALTLRILLGVPQISEFLTKLKLIHYYNVMMAPQSMRTNIFAEHQARNYGEMMREYGLNGEALKGMRDQWRFDTMDWIRCIDRWGLPQCYKYAQWLPFTERGWRSIIEKRFHKIYESELDTFLKGHGRVFVAVFGLDALVRRHRKRPYRGLMEEIRFLYDGDVSTTKLARSVKVLLNSTKLNYVRANGVGSDGVSAVGVCPLCHRRRNQSANIHAIWHCPAVARSGDMQWLHCKDFGKNLHFLEELQLRIDEL